MNSSSTFFRRLAGAFALASGLASPAGAQDCRLTLSASDHFLSPGETAEVYAWAHFPPTVYAFASSTFDVEADSPGWLAASSGVIAGDSVWDAEEGQSHQPHLGMPADPANPLRIWKGTFAPETWEPRCIAIEATPDVFEVYPSPLTSSSAPCPADPGATRIIINPVVAGNVAFAPIDGTPLRATWQRGGGMQILLGDGSVRTVGAGVHFGLLLPAVQPVRESAARMDATGEPATLSIIAILIGLLHDIPTETVEMSWTRMEGGYRPAVDIAAATGSTFRVFRSGRVLAEFSSPDGVAPFALGALPDAHLLRLGDERLLDVHTTMVYEAPIPCIIPGKFEQLIDRVEVATSTGINNLKQISIGLHTWEAEPDRKPVTLGITVDVECRVDLNGDAAVDFFDFLAFQALFSSGDALADFTADGAIDFFDFLAFQEEFSRGCR